jgi:hypothetical protein
MKMFRLLTVVPAALAISLMFAEANLAQVPSIEIKPKLQSDPLVLSGKSGGSVPSNCGNLSATPNQVIQVTDSMPYLRLTVESQGKPTLLIDGPGGRFCVLGDNYSGGKPEISGFWLAGTYRLYVGDSSNKQYNYMLSISQQKLPKK